MTATESTDPAAEPVREDCGRCNGRGEINRGQHNDPEFDGDTCPVCRGSGKKPTPAIANLWACQEALDTALAALRTIDRDAWQHAVRTAAELGWAIGDQAIFGAAGELAERGGPRFSPDNQR